MSEETTATQAPTDVAWNPLYDKVIVRRLPEEEKAGRFAVPEKYRRAQNVGVVLRVGGGRWIEGVLYPLTLQPGHLVLFSHYAGVQLGDDVDLLVLREDEVLAFQEPQP